MKNLDFALRALSMVQEKVDFTVYGPAEDQGYWEECQALVGRLPENVRFQYLGAVSAKDVPHLLADQDLFFLPTRGENFGHVIVEAFGAGLPVLTSDRTPWRHLESRGVGWDLPVGDEALPRFVERIDAVARFSEVELRGWRLRARELAESIARDTKVLDENRTMFETIIGTNR